MTNTNLNAQATQLAVDAAYYEQKAQKCWEILSNIDSFVTFNPNELLFSISTGSRGMTALPIHLSDITTINKILMELMSYYRTKYAKAQQQLNELKQREIPVRLT